MNRKYETLKTKHDELETENRALESKFSALETKYSKLDKEFKELDKGFKELDKEFQELDKEHKALKIKEPEVKTEKFEDQSDEIKTLQCILYIAAGTCFSFNLFLETLTEFFRFVWIAFFLSCHDVLQKLQSKVFFKLDGSQWCYICLIRPKNKIRLGKILLKTVQAKQSLKIKKL